MKEKEQPQSEPIKKSHPRKILKRLIWPAISLTLSIIIIFLLLYKPAGYVPADQVAVDGDKQLSQEVTNHLIPEFYNGIQQNESFEMIISENEINELIAHAKWPKYSEGFIFYAPKASLSIDKIGLMCTILQFGLDVELVVTVEIEPSLNEKGLLSINATQLKVGAVDITPLAAFLGKRMYQEQKPDYIYREDWRGKIADSIFENSAFEPIFKAKGRWVKVEGFDIENGLVRIRLKPTDM